MAWLSLILTPLNRAYPPWSDSFWGPFWDASESSIFVGGSSGFFAKSVVALKILDPGKIPRRKLPLYLRKVKICRGSTLAKNLKIWIFEKRRNLSMFYREKWPNFVKSDKIEFFLNDRNFPRATNSKNSGTSAPENARWQKMQLLAGNTTQICSRKTQNTTFSP